MKKATVPLQVRVNKERKERVKKILERYGIPLSVAIEMFFAKTEEMQGIPFHVQRSPEVPNAKTAKVLDGILANERKGRISPTFSNTKDAAAYLKAKVL